jgi:alpha-galactosidase
MILIWCICLFAPTANAQKKKLVYDAQIGEKEILTPLAEQKPVINGAAIYGAKPEKLFEYRIPCQGQRPIEFVVEGLPDGLSVNEEGIISGITPSSEGTYHISISATNDHGIASRLFKLVIGEKTARTPPTGWNSWGGHMINVSEELVRYTADLMVSSGLADVGFQYINLDDCWMMMSPESYESGKEWYDKSWQGFDFSSVVGEVRDEYGQPNWNSKFKDVKGMTDYVHSKGLKIGLYSSPGERTCQKFEGSFGYEAIDAQSYAEWGFDFLKYDLCGDEIKAMQWMSKILDSTSVGNEGENYAIHQLPIWYPMAYELDKQSRDVLLNLCQYGWQEVEKWSPQMGYPTWRMGGDLNHHVDTYKEVALKIATELREYCKPGQWADPDYMYIHFLKNARNKGADSEEIPLNTNQRYQYVTLWSVISAPFFFSCDMYKIDEFTTRLLSNNEVLNINQDELGHVAEVIKNEDGDLILLKIMAGGSKVLAVLNTENSKKEISISIADLGFEKAEVRDVWRKKDVGKVKGDLITTLSGHGVCLYHIQPM